MTVLTSARKLSRDTVTALAGAAASLVIALVLFTRFSLYDTLTRDQAIYAYGGQRMAHGVPPYTSIFDPKTPMATLVSGVAASLARLTGRNELTAIRLAFFVITLLMVLAIYVLAVRLWDSVAGAVIAAVVFACFNVVASEALAGPEAKAPGILAAIITMWLVIERRWFWAAFAAAAAFLSWQPLVVYPVMVAVIGLVEARSQRTWRPIVQVVTGAASPFAVLLVYFGITQGIGNFFESAFEFPATGVTRAPYSFTAHMGHIFHTVNYGYGFSGGMLWAGDIILAGLVVAHLVRNRHDLRAAVREPLVCIVVITMLGELGYAIYDFEGPPDVFPFLAYPPLGFAGLTALVVKSLTSTVRRQAATVAALAAAAVLVGFSFVWFANSPSHNDGLRAEQADACAVERLLGHQPGLYSLGDPIPLVMTDQVNPDRFVYLGEGVQDWKVKHTPGGVTGWIHEIHADHPSLVVVEQWGGPYRTVLERWLRSKDYRPRYVGIWHVYLRPAMMDRALRQGVDLTYYPTPYATGLSGTELPAAGCH